VRLWEGHLEGQEGRGQTRKNSHRPKRLSRTRNDCKGEEVEKYMFGECGETLEGWYGGGGCGVRLSQRWFRKGIEKLEMGVPS